MSTCDTTRDSFSLYLEDELDEGRRADFEAHVAACGDCRELLASLEEILEFSQSMAVVEPPANLESEVADSPCRRWLGLLFSAIDREISETNLDRLFQHLESCPSCRAAWGDFSLIHQLGQAMTPPVHLLARCLRPRRPFSARRVLGRRTATAAAYSLAILASLAIGNPVTLARYEATSPVHQVNALVEHGVADAADTGRSEARVMLYRALNYGRRTADAARAAWEKLTSSKEKPDADHSDNAKESTS